MLQTPPKISPPEGLISHRNAFEQDLSSESESDQENNSDQVLLLVYTIIYLYYYLITTIYECLVMGPLHILILL